MFLFTASCAGSDAPKTGGNKSPESQNSSASGSGTNDILASLNNNNNNNKNNNNSDTQKTSPLVPDDSKPATKQSDKKDSGTNENTAPGGQGSYVDLTILGSTMLSAELTNIRANLGKYLNKTIKIRGSYSSYYSEETDTLYCYVITYMDATSCCSEGMEFKWNGNHEYPDDYPAEGARIEIEGILESYKEQDRQYCYIAADEISILG